MPSLSVWDAVEVNLATSLRDARQPLGRRLAYPDTVSVDERTNIGGSWVLSVAMSIAAVDDTYASWKRVVADTTDVIEDCIASHVRAGKLTLRGRGRASSWCVFTLAAQNATAGSGLTPEPRGLSSTSTATKLCPGVQPHERCGVGRPEAHGESLIVEAGVGCAVAVVIEEVDLRELNDSHEIGRDATDVDADAEIPDEDEGVWGKVVEKPPRDSDADAQASHPVTVPGTGTAHVLTRPFGYHRSPSSQLTGSSNVSSNSDSRRVFLDVESP